MHTNCFNLDIFSLYFLQLLFFLLNFSSSFLTFYLPALLCPWLIPSTWVDPFETVGLPYSWGLADGSQTSSNQKYLAIQRQQYFPLTPLQPPAPAPTSPIVFFSHTIPAPASSSSLPNAVVMTLLVMAMCGYRVCLPNLRPWQLTTASSLAEESTVNSALSGPVQLSNTQTGVFFRFQSQMLDA